MDRRRAGGGLPCQQWRFNISTKSLAAGSTYVYTIKLNDGTAIVFQFGLN